jgi:dephospho-CoA kinase
MKIIGLTGSIGSGKSAVAQSLETLGAVHIDADKVGHEIYNPGTPGWQDIVNSFGKGVLSPEGTVDRKKLSQIVFNDPEALAKLNKLLHPRIRQKIETHLVTSRQQGKVAAVIEATLLVEAGWMDMVDELWLVTAPPEQMLERLKKRGLSESESLARLASQTSAEVLEPKATVVIKNDSSLEQLQASVEKLWKERLNKKAK